MKILNQTISRVIILFSIFAMGLLSAQTVTAKSSKVVVNGTSSLHDWNMTATAATFSGTESGNALTNVKFTMGAKTLKSTKGGMMDNKAYKALKADKNPNITFTAASLPMGKSNVTGKLTIAGVTKNITLPVNVAKNGNSYTITGAESLKMSDYGMEAPGFLGVHTGDAVTVNVTIVTN